MSLELLVYGIIIGCLAGYIFRVILESILVVVWGGRAWRRDEEERKRVFEYQVRERMKTILIKRWPIYSSQVEREALIRVQQRAKGLWDRLPKREDMCHWSYIGEVPPRDEKEEEKVRA